jgi:hypothetical protein
LQLSLIGAREFVGGVRDLYFMDDKMDVMIRLKFPPHCQERMVERGIDADHIRKAINSPDLQRTTFQGTILVRKKIDADRAIEVIYFKDGFRDTNDFIIITAVYLKS